jgi:hypothetical protein
MLLSGYGWALRPDESGASELDAPVLYGFSRCYKNSGQFLSLAKQTKKPFPIEQPFINDKLHPKTAFVRLLDDNIQFRNLAGRAPPYTSSTALRLLPDKSGQVCRRAGIAMTISG